MTLITTEYQGPSESKLVKIQFLRRLVTFKMSVNILKETAFTYALIFHLCQRLQNELLVNLTVGIWISEQLNE